MNNIKLKDRAIAKYSASLASINSANESVPALYISTNKDIKFTGSRLNINGVCHDISSLTIGEVCLLLIANGVDCKITNNSVIMVPAILLEDISNTYTSSSDLTTSPYKPQHSIGSKIKNLLSLDSNSISLVGAKAWNKDGPIEITLHNGLIFSDKASSDTKLISQFQLHKFIVWYQKSKTINANNIVHSNTALSHMVLEKMNSNIKS
jgi:hypothetical protein